VNRGGAVGRQSRSWRVGVRWAFFSMATIGKRLSTPMAEIDNAVGGGLIRRIASVSAAFRTLFLATHPSSHLFVGFVLDLREIRLALVFCQRFTYFLAIFRRHLQKVDLRRPILVRIVLASLAPGLFV
jgi:hypothetical protein